MRSSRCTSLECLLLFDMLYLSVIFRSRSLNYYNIVCRYACSGYISWNGDKWNKSENKRNWYSLCRLNWWYAPACRYISAVYMIVWALLGVFCVSFFRLFIYCSCLSLFIQSFFFVFITNETGTRKKIVVVSCTQQNSLDDDTV